ncbi:interferon-inducible GTPase 1-like isoform X2 [Dreissena polymorpha]|uniref:IRG-type G domain-containing protein n=1 Tax=Dreissena polymorpha TaxID=45954 RepID=A0A9D4CJC1_DREPO|nr:interferon-inducible GTPase 1-like isoform X2 [Dreissena polymorpha]KAH3726378.1 hypothetical protein DPMN_052240 [Dreissena polymorpha]
MSCVDCGSSMSSSWNYCHCDGNAIGSEEIEDDELFTEEETHEFESVLEKSGYAEHMNQLENTIDNYTKIQIKVAVSGSTGSGKSSLINTLRGLKANDKGAAKTGLVETTKEPTCYLFPNNQNFSLWDLPGVGSQNFPQDTYLDKVRFSDYDFIILVSSSCFTTEDAWLASEIITRFPQIKLFFIRTKIDTDLTNKEADLGRTLTYEEKVYEMKIIKDDICKNLAINGITDQNIFLVNNHKASEFEFGQFTEKIVIQVSSLKQNAFILSLDIQTAEIVPFKIKLLQKRIAKVSKQAAKAVVNIRKITTTISENDILNKEIHMYMQQLGINKQSVDKMAKMYDVSRSSNEVMKAIAFVTKRFEEKMKELKDKRETEKPSAWYSLPFIGRWMELRKYQKESYMILRNMLNACFEANKIVFNTVGQLLRR